jgi:hypothetical protein
MAAPSTHRCAIFWTVSVALGAAAGGCAARSTPAQVADVERLQLAFVRDGVTTREEVLLRLGVPSAQFEGERILTYRLGLDAKGALGPMSPQVAAEDRRFAVWTRSAYNLVLVFDPGNVLRRHSFIEVR